MRHFTASAQSSGTNVANDLTKVAMAEGPKLWRVGQALEEAHHGQRCCVAMHHREAEGGGPEPRREDCGRLGAQRRDVAGLQGVRRGVQLLGPKVRIERLQRGRL